MERSREARRSSSSMATGNGAPKRRHRSNSLRDSPEEGQVELQEAVRLRNKKDRDRDRDRELLMSNRNKRRRGSKREEEEESTEESVGDEEEEEEEYDAAAADDNSHRRNFPPKRTARHWKVGDEMIGVSFPRKARSASAKRAHENIVSANGGGEEPVGPGSPSSSNVSVRKKMKAGGSKTRPPKASSAQEDIEIEIAEVLYGLKKQSQSQSNKTNGNSSQEFDPNPNPNPSDNNGSSAVMVTATQTCGTKMEGEKCLGTVENSVIESEQLEKTETCSSSSQKECVSLESQKEAAIMIMKQEDDPKQSRIDGCEKPTLTNMESAKLNAVDDLQDSTKAVLTVPETERKRGEKLEIDLMAMPSSLDGDEGFMDSISDPKPPVKDEEKVERFVEKEMVMEESEERRKNKVETIGEKSELPKIDLEKPSQDSGSAHSIKLQQHQQQQAKAGIPKVETTVQSGSVPLPIAVTGWSGGLPSLGYMPPFQTVVPMDGITASATSSQPPQFVLSQPRPKRCATHHYIARNICLHQRFTKMDNVCPAPAGAAALGGAKMNNLNAMPPAEKMIFGNPFQGSFPGKNLTNVQEKGRAGTNFPGNNGKDKGCEAAILTETAQGKQVVLQQAAQLAPAGSLMHGPAFIFSMSQHAAAGANQSGSSKLANPAKNVSLTSNSAAGSLGSNAATGPLGSSPVLPAVATAVSFNYPSFPASEAPYMAILQNNGYPVPISTPVGTTTTAFRGSNPAQTMPFFNGPFYSSQMFHPSQLQQQQPHLQPLVQTTHQSTSTSSGGLSSSHKQPRGAQVSGNNLLASSGTQLQQQQKQNLPPSNQSRKLEAEMTRENTPSVADSRASHTQKSVYGQNFTVPVQPLNFTLMPSAPLGGSSGGNHGEKQQQGIKGAVELFPSPAFGMSFAAFNGSNSASTLNFSSMPQNPVIFQSFPDMVRQGYQVALAPQAAQQKNHQVSEGKNGANLINPDDAKKAPKNSSTTTGQTLVFDNSARTLNFMSSPVTCNWPSRSVTSTTITTNAPTAGNASNSQQQQQLLQLQIQKQHMMQQQQHALPARSKAPTTNGFSSSNMVAKFPNNPPVFSQTIIHSNSSVQSSHSKNAGRTPASQAPTTSSVASNASTLKNLSQQQGRAPPGPAQISFGGNPKSALAPHGQQIHANTQSSSTSASGSPSTGGNLRTNSTGGKAGSSINTLQSQQTENSSGGTGQKSSPVCGRNVPSILNTCPSHLSELKY